MSVFQTITKAKRICGEIDNIASDKSLSHRCAIFALLSDKPSYIENFLYAQDTLNSLKIAQALGLEVKYDDARENGIANRLTLIPPKGIKESNDILDCGNAGTAIRLYTGLLSGIKGRFILSGDKYLQIRPMGRVIKPLRDIGAKIKAREDNFAPIEIEGSRLEGFNYHSNIASAQVKSAMILAGLHASNESFFSEVELSRNHSENMLIGMGANLVLKDGGIKISPLEKALNPLSFRIPADPSSAFFIALAAAILPDSEVLLKNVLLNPTRLEAFRVLEKMGTTISYQITESTYESIGDIYVKYGELRGVDLDENIAWLIDEIPALSIAMACANGVSRVRCAKELRVKECDRIKAIVLNLRAMGIECIEYEDGFEISGGRMHSARVSSFGDHRIAMSFGVAGLVCGVEIEDFSYVDISFPNFLEILQKYSLKDGRCK